MTRLLFQLLIFFLPSQLAYHLWPTWSYVFGIRIDYLSFTVYFTDIIVLLLILSLLFRKNKFTINLPLLTFILLFSILNILVALSWQIAFLKWMKVLELILIILFLSQEREFDLESWFTGPLKYSLIFFSLIAIFQFVVQSSLGGIFWFLGERTFSSQTPGIAQVTLLGEERLRPYSTFPHPNSLAGYFLVGFFLVFESFIKKKSISKALAIVLSFFTLLLTFSLGAFLGLLTSLIFFWLTKMKKNISFLVYKLFFLNLTSSLFFSVFIDKVGDKFFSGQDVFYRAKLALVTGEIISKSPFLGVGLGNFIISLEKFNLAYKVRWFLQPVHNIFLLVFSEAGLVGLIFFSLFFLKSFELALKKDKVFVMVLVAILITGLFDHYWLTIQQNTMLFAVILGLVYRKNLKLN